MRPFTGTRAEYSVTAAQVTTTFRFPQETLMGVLPHQYISLVPPVGKVIGTFDTVHGPIRLIAGSTFRTALPRPSILPSLPPLKTAINWDVPFTSQAPHANWDEVHEEACEEASVLMVLKYFRGETFASAEDANREIDEILASNESLGFPVDDTAEQVVTLLRHEDPSLTAVLLQHPTVDDLKKVLSEGKLVIVPAAGQELGNPYFTAPGPRYHMLVLRGYTQDGYVITNDPGTKRGKEYAYSWNVLMDAIHDWNGGDVENGAKVVVVVSK
jgi:hypothetical protein